MVSSIMTRRSSGATQPPPGLPLQPRLARELEQGRDLAFFIYRADQRLKRQPITHVFGDDALSERQRAQLEARARVAVRLGDPANVAGAVENAAQAILIDIADRVANRSLDGGDGECYLDVEGARRIAKIAYEAAFNHLAGLHLVGREGK